MPRVKTEEKALSNSNYTREELRAELERLGESVVRMQLINGLYGSAGRKHLFVEEWLRLKQAAREPDFESRHMGRPHATAAAEKAAMAAEQAARAADRQALAAESANGRATIALVIAAISLVATIISVAINVTSFLKFWHWQ
jgi:hypothetical protein